LILDFCCVCGKTDDLNQHHVIPKSSGGSNYETNLITLCYEHHNWVHSRKYRDNINHTKLIRDGVAAAKARGVVFGRTSLPQDKINEIIKLRKTGMGMNRIAKQLRVGNSQILKICQEMCKVENLSMLQWKENLARNLKK